VRQYFSALLVGLLLWVEPVSAKVYWLTVSISPGVNPTLTKVKIKQILESASALLDHNGCDVEFKLKGLVPFTSAPAKITDARTLEAVHRVPADVKVVQSISYCVEKKGFFIGCSWRPKNRPRTVIVTNEEEMTGNDPMLWAHEFGHTTGLLHRNDKYNFVLMTPSRSRDFGPTRSAGKLLHFRGQRTEIGS
jgi:hypothetical protein